MNSHIYEGLFFGSPVVVTPWKIIGMIGALFFASRWFVQAYYSRKAGKPITPRLFWVMSLVGSITTLAYFVFSPKQDMVGVIQNLFPFIVSAYNMYLDSSYGRKAIEARRVAQSRSVPSPASALSGEPAVE